MTTFDPSQLTFTSNCTDYRIFYRGIPIAAAGTSVSKAERTKRYRYNRANAKLMREAAQHVISTIQQLYPHRHHIQSHILDRIVEIDAATT